MADIDLVFIDADKRGYPAYWAELVPRVRSGGLLLADNVLWSGTIIDPPADDDAAALQAFNRTVAADDRVEVVMLTAFSQRELVDRARQAGAMAYVVKPFGKADLIPAIEIARARFAEITAVEAEVEDLTERLESRKAVDRAKGMLQTGLGLTEPEAFRWIQKTAMDLRKSMREVAEGVIEHGAGAKKK